MAVIFTLLLFASQSLKLFCVKMLELHMLLLTNVVWACNVLDIFISYAWFPALRCRCAGAITWLCHSQILLLSKQEGQHPLTRQRATNFRLLANQWAERRLVTQWRDACRAMRRSVCNAGASNAGWSLCVQISRKWSYLLPICWYHSKGNWLRYNCAADSFYIRKLCSRLFVLYCRNCPKDDKFR